MPPKYMLMYVTALPITSSGVSISPKIIGENTSPKTINTAPPTMPSAMEVCTAWLVSRLFPAPKYWDMITVEPAETPTKNPTRRFTIVPVPPPTAASALFPTKLPTIMASAVLYSCWKNVPRSIGKKKTSICFQITPWVILFSPSTCRSPFQNNQHSIKCICCLHHKGDNSHAQAFCQY